MIEAILNGGAHEGRKLRVDDGLTTIRMEGEPIEPMNERSILEGRRYQYEYVKTGRKEGDAWEFRFS
ncbi:hypothetical protein [Vreelandella populi]|uniref:Uncharacterized protein n=1 Tax=Vreelandella populi TaxID=2498858 RepID=A0A3S0X3A0_9GAMM|nr:hypothetical protein [Halomonas populi]RUR48778.1 hypothetical protein ELY37_02710 [Halomonas populi]